MTIDEAYKYFDLDTNEFFKRLENYINTNRISTTNKTCPMRKLYMEVRKDKINEHIKPTKGRLNIAKEQK